MANTLDPMDLRQIISLHLDGYSNRKIGATLGVSRNTVNSYMKRFIASEYPLEELLNFDNEKLSKLFTSFTTMDIDRQDELMRCFEQVNHARNHPGFTFLYHYQEYKNTAANPYSYTQFMEHYHRKYPSIKGSMKLEHIAGEELFIDFSGKKLQIVDKQTGEIIQKECLVVILPHSQYTYVEALDSQKSVDLIPGCIRALEYFGGAPKAIVSDNLKSAVTRSNKYEPVINRSFKDFARHYSCVVNPTRAYSPQDKALVENAVHLVYQRIFYPIREMIFFSLEELNQEIQRLLEEYNRLLFQRKGTSRRELFQTVERQYLKPLPEQPYELKEYRRAKVQKMGYVYFSPDKTYYSVPYRYIGKNTMIHYTKSMVEVYYNHERIALHRRNPSMGIYITNKDHLSSEHKAVTEWSPEYFKSKAAPLGSHVLRCVEHILTNLEYPEVGYKRIMGIIQLHKLYGVQRLNKACQRALIVESVSFTRIKNILENNMDKASLFFNDLEENTPHIPIHENIRGASAYE